MSHMKNKVDWCLKKAEKEIAEGKKHRGLIEVNPSKEKARGYIRKAEHYLEAALLLEQKFSDIGLSSIFYSMYHSMLAILVKFGFESRNQECTFALIYSLIEDNKIDLKKEDVDRIALMSDESVIGLREKYQYGVELSMNEEIYNDNFEFSKKILGKVKELVER